MNDWSGLFLTKIIHFMLLGRFRWIVHGLLLYWNNSVKQTLSLTSLFHFGDSQVSDFRRSQFKVAAGTSLLCIMKLSVQVQTGRQSSLLSYFCSGSQLLSSTEHPGCLLRLVCRPVLLCCRWFLIITS